MSPSSALPAMRKLLQFPKGVLLHVQLLLLGAVSLAWNLAAFVLYPLLPRERGLRLGRAVISHSYRACWALGELLGLMKLDASALDTLAGEPGLIVVANHPSMLDALILVSRLPRSACIMKAELIRNPFLGAGAKLARYIRNDSPRGLIRLAVADLQRGGQLVVFPEGTRTTLPPVNRPFRPGVPLIAKLAKAPIQAVFIETDSPYLTKGWPIWRLPPMPIAYTVRLGRRFEPQADTDALLSELEQYFATHLPSRPAPRA
jgi:1-acyl-sn-glycerol-3-phosphate acyltransferase